MTSLEDLGRALRDDAAANAPRASAIDVDAVTRAARARRRPRQWAVGTLGLAAVLGLGGVAVAAVTPPSLIAATESAEEGDMLLSEEIAGGGAEAPSATADERAADLLACGAAAPAPAPGPLGLELELQLPASAPATAGAVDGVVRITNTGTAAMTIVTGTAAGGVLTRDGVIVGTEAGRDGAAIEFTLAAGELRELPVRIDLTSCGATNEQPLPAGSYQAVVLLHVVGGPAAGPLVAPSAELRID